MEEKFLQIGKGRLFFRHSGKGPALLILHGWGISSEKFLPLQKFLEEKFEVFNLDLPGFGKSDEPERAFSVDDYKEIVKSFIKELKLKDYFILAHSFGGRIALKLAAEKPQALKGLILTGCAGLPQTLSWKRKTFKISVKLSQKLFQLPFLNKLQPFGRKFASKIDSGSDYARLTSEIMRQTFQKVIAEDLTDCLKQIAAPTLILWGRNDQMTPLTDGQIMSKKISNSQLKVFEEVGHKLPYEKPEIFAEAVFEWMK